MNIFHWDEILESGDPEIDAQHRDLFQEANRLHESIMAGKGPEVITSIGCSIHRDAVHHFGVEERLMRSLQYPGLEDHIEDHRKFSDLLEGMVASGQKMTPLQIIQVFNSLIRDHILEVDLPMIRWVRMRRSPTFLGETVASALNPDF
ncbi:MAG: hemerythrin family protein [Fibrobacterota bacterium]|nr:MAG: hemerythrin family protein [Fibrobacterota bacterium]